MKKIIRLKTNRANIRVFTVSETCPPGFLQPAARSSQTPQSQFLFIYYNIRMLGKILDKATYLKAKLQRDELQIALAQATTDDNWQASTSILHEIASSSYDRQKWKRINQFLWDKLKNNKNWKKILKALNIVEFLLKNGPQFACNQLRYEVRFFKTLESFTEYEGSSDRGAPIRERAKSITSLLENQQLLEDQRLRAHQIRQKMSHLTGGNTYKEGKSGGQMPRYQSYSNQTYSQTKQRGQGYYNYGHGNYGDRNDDRKFNHDYFQNINRFKKTEPERPVTPPPQPERKEQKVERERQSEPVPLKVKNQTGVESPSKAKFGLITQQLLKGNKAKNNAKVDQQSQVLKPDLSYKVDKNEEQLIDLDEQSFMEQRYHFDNTSKNQVHSVPKTSTTHQTTEQLKSFTFQQSEQSINPVNQTPTSTGGFDSFDFLGISLGSQQSAPNPNTNSTPSPQVESQSISQPLNPISQSPQQTIPPTSVQYQQFQNFPPQIGSFNSIYYQQAPPVPPPFNPYNPYQQYNPYGYNQSYQSFSPPPLNYGPPSYPQYNNYSNQNLSGYYQSSPPPNPYANISQNLNSLTFESTSLSSQNVVSEPSKETSKQNMSKGSNMGDLTDLSDIMSDISSKKRTEPKKNTLQHNNNIKIDPWAW